MSATLDAPQNRPRLGVAAGMIDTLVVGNFKSLGDLRLGLDKFTCLIGMNGSGKSSILQSIDLLSQMMVGGLDGWLDSRDWDAIDLTSKGNPNPQIHVGIKFRTSVGHTVRWAGVFNRTTLTCSSETARIDDDVALEVLRRRLRTSSTEDFQDVDFVYQGSILSQLRDERLPPALKEFRDAIRSICSLELLAPNLMRKRSRVTDRDIGSGGEKLSSFLHGIRGENRERLLRLLKSFYPRLVDFKITSQRAGWKKLSVFEQFGDHRIETEARHLNDGLLRVLAILAQAGSDRSLILLDEIENGINPEIVEQLVDALIASPQQVLVTTHSPMILNYLEDDVAREAVQFVYKGPMGDTRVRRFFDSARIGDKLDVMGPGEAFVDTDLNALAAEFVALDERERVERERVSAHRKADGTAQQRTSTTLERLP